MRRKNPLVRLSSKTQLLHGTSAKSVRNIARRGLTPGGGSSVHYTKTRGAIFLTNSIEAAMGYSTGHGRELGIAVIVIRAGDLEVEPDWDDMQGRVGDQIDELNKHVKGELVLGEEVPEDLVDETERFIESMNEEGLSVLSLEMSGVKGDDRWFLHASPRVTTFGVGQSVVSPQAISEDDNLTWIDGEPYINAEQYLCRCTLLPAKIEGFFLDEAAEKIVGVSRSRSDGKTSAVNYFADPVDQDNEDYSPYWPDAVLHYYPRSAIP